MKYEQVPYHWQYDRGKLLEGETIYRKQEIILAFEQEICQMDMCSLVLLP